MYPGGQCVNTCVYAQMNGATAAYLGKFGSDDAAECIQSTLRDFGIDYSHCRYFDGENGFACVTLDGVDRVFIGSNKGGVAATNPFLFVEDDYDYIKGFDLVYTNLNAYLDDDIASVAATGVPVAFDFSTRWTDEYFARICPHIKVALMSCAHLDDVTREFEMRKAATYGIPIVLGTVGEDGSYLLYRGDIMYAKAVKATDVVDTMGAGDSYFAAFLVTLAEYLKEHSLTLTDDYDLTDVLRSAMTVAAEFAAKMCSLEGAFGHGVPLSGRIIDNRQEA